MRARYSLKRILKVFGWALLILLATLATAWFGFLRPEPLPVSEADRSRITLMPLPASLKLGRGSLILDENLCHEFSGLSTPRMERAVERFYSGLSSRTGMDLGEGDNGILVLQCSGNAMEKPAYGDDESYSLKISRTRIILKAPAETGIIYGLESLLQLAEKRDGAWVLPVLALHDEPRYGWRGLMIDASRHWIPKEVILRNLDAMAAVKMNVFHWHLTDNQGFRVESKLFPKLHEMGSGGNYYTQDDIREVVEYAADRAIRVIPEFDLPGHSLSWFAGYPELASTPGSYRPDTTYMVSTAVMDPTREEVYRFLDLFLGEMTGLFPDHFIHMGGDEVVPTQWEENSRIRSYMQLHGLKDPRALQAHFNRRIQQLLSAHGKKMIGWDEMIHPDLLKEGLVIQTWRDHGSLWETARQGSMALLSAGYYLDHKQPASFHYRVDPAVIQGAVQIEIDSTNWRSWACKLRLSEMVLDGELYLFGGGDQLRGIMNFMGGSTGFTGVTATGDQLAFNLESSAGRINFETVLSGDSISGTGKISFFILELTGIRSGGSDMAQGDPLPQFKKIEPLTPDQEANLVGGEACMWTEMADGVTLESRIWPRAAAVAEKLWSPASLTGDVKDMYRRLMVLDGYLEMKGLMHRRYRDLLLSGMTAPPYLDPLGELVSLLHEDQFFNRMILYVPGLFTTTPLNRVVDASPPESYPAYRFAGDVELWLETADTLARERITRVLESWAKNHERLAPAFTESELLKEVEAHSIHLSRLANLGLEALSGNGFAGGGDPEIEALFAAAAIPFGGTVLSVVDPVKKLVESAQEK